MKRMIKSMVFTTILAMSIGPAVAKPKPHKHVSAHTQKAKTLQEYIAKHCKKACVNANQLRRAVKDISAKHKVPPNLVIAVLKVESRFKRTAVAAGNYGLMQVNLASHRKKFAGADPFNVEANLNVGSRVLKECLIESGNNIMEALACYKGGKNREYNKEVKDAMLVLASLQ